MTLSTMAGVALPVWIDANSWNVWSSAFFIFALASVSRGWDMVVGVCGKASAADKRSDLLAGHPAQDRVLLVQVQHEDRHVVVEAQGEGRRVHDLEALLQGVDEADLVVLHGVRVLLRVLVVDAVDLCRLDDYVCVQLGGAQGVYRVGREIGVARARDEDDQAPLLEVADRAAQDERLGDLVHRYRALDPGHDAHLLQPVHDRHAVDDGREHAHVVARRPVDAASLAREPAENVPAPDDDAYLHAELVDLLHLPAGPLEGAVVDGVPGLLAPQELARELKD